MICIFTSPVLLKCFYFIYLFILFFILQVPYFILFFILQVPYFFFPVLILTCTYTHTRKVHVYENTLGHDHYSDSVSILNSN